MNTATDIEQRLWEYIDGLSTDEENDHSKNDRNQQWKNKYHELIEVHQLLNLPNWNNLPCGLLKM